MSQATNNYLIGATGNPVDSTLAGVATNESYLALKNPPRVQLSNTIATQLPNCPCGYVTVQNPLGNDTVFIGGLDGSNDTPYLDPNYPGQGRGQMIYPGTSQIFRVVNSNLLQAIANRNGDVINVIPHLSQSDFTTPSGDPPPNPQYLSPLAVISTSPTNGATGVLQNTVAKAIFSRNINPATATSTNFVISPAVATSIVYVDPSNPAEVDVDPQGQNLVSNTLYTVTAGVNIQDTNGVSLASPVSFSFTTAASSPPPDTTPPTVASTSPANGDSGVSLSVTPIVVMSEAVQAATVNTTNVQLLDSNSAPVSTTVSLAVDKETITITPAANLSDGSVYTIQVSGIKDIAGNVMSSTFTATFTTTSTFTQFYNVSGSNSITIGNNLTYEACGERVQTTSSALIGKIPRKIVVNIAVLPGTNGSVGLHWDDNGINLVADFGSVNCSSIGTSPSAFTFELPSNNSSFVHGDWIGLKCSGVTTGGVIVYRTSVDAYDGINSYVNFFNASGYIGNSPCDFACTMYT